MNKVAVGMLLLLTIVVTGLVTQFYLEKNYRESFSRLTLDRMVVYSELINNLNSDDEDCIDESTKKGFIENIAFDFVYMKSLGLRLDLANKNQLVALKNISINLLEASEVYGADWREINFISLDYANELYTNASAMLTDEKAAFDKTKAHLMNFKESFE